MAISASSRNLDTTYASARMRETLRGGRTVNSRMIEMMWRICVGYLSSLLPAHLVG